MASYHRKSSTSENCPGCDDHRKNAPHGLCKLKVASDGLPVRCVGQWSEDKHYYLQRYVHVFTTSMRVQWTLCYIDLFAGPGKCIVRGTAREISGSPLIALGARYPFHKYIFVEMNEDAINALRGRLSKLGELWKRTHIVQGDCNERIGDVVKLIPPRSLCLAVIDPTGLQFQFRTLERLVSGRKVDLISVYPEGMSVRRNIANFIRAKESLLDRFIGDREWRGTYANTLSNSAFEAAVRDVAKHYRSKVERLGYIFSADKTVRTTSTRVPLYLLSFASKHELGERLWRKATQIEPRGQRTFVEINEPHQSYTVVPPLPATAPPMPNLVYRPFVCLDGSKRKLVDKVNDGSIIARFAKTPYPRKPTDVVCPHFLELKWAYGCPYNCSWCYLRGTFRFHPHVFEKPVFKDRQKIETHLRAFLDQVETPEILNAGELADSLMFENIGEPFSKFVIPLFENQQRHRVLFVTKSPNVQHLLAMESHNQVILSFSLNAVKVAEKWEKAPPVKKRIEAAKKLSEAGYEVRLRIDPVVPIEGWEKHYSSLLILIFDSLRPERITLGSLRGLQSTINGCSDKTWTVYLSETSNWGKKIAFDTRQEMYAALIAELREQYGFTKVALCKETMAMWRRLGMDYRTIACNCVW